MNMIPYEQRVQVYRGALEHFGRTIQMVMALEELSECQKEICKQLRGYDNLEHLAEEIADATIMLEQMRLFFGVNELVCQKMDQKVQRLEALLKENGLYGGGQYEEWKAAQQGNEGRTDNLS